MQKFLDAFEILRQIEIIRRKLSTRWNRLLKNTGAIVIKHPTIQHVFWGLLWVICSRVEQMKNIEIRKVLQFHQCYPYVTLEGFDVPEEIKNIGQDFNDYFELVFDSRAEIKPLLENVSQNFKILDQIIDIPDLLFEGISVNPLELGLIKRKCKKNVREIKKGKMVAEYCKKNISSAIKDLKVIINILEGMAGKEKEIKLQNIYTVGSIYKDMVRFF